MAQTLTTQILDPLLKESVLPEIKTQFQEKKALYQWLMTGQGEEITSKGCGIPAYVRPSASNGWRGEKDLFPTPVSDEDIRMRVRYTRYRRAFEISGDAMQQLDSPQNLLKGLAARIARHTNSAMKEINQQLYGTGTGEVGVVATSGVNQGANRLTFATTTAGGSTHGSRKVLVNGKYNMVDPATGTIRKNGGSSAFVLTCVSVDRPNARATFDDVPSDAADADILVYDGSYNKALRGLKYHVNDDSGYYQTISRADYEMLRAVVINAGGSQITIALMSKLDHEMLFRNELDDDSDMVYLMSPAQRFGYELLGHAIREIDGVQERKYDGGFKEVSYNGKNFVIDVDCDHDRIYKLRKNTLKKFELREFSVIENEGKVLWDVPAFDNTGTGTHVDAWRIYFGMEAELGCDMPSGNGVITNLSITGLPLGQLV